MWVVVRNDKGVGMRGWGDVGMREMAIPLPRDPTSQRPLGKQTLFPEPELDPYPPHEPGTGYARHMPIVLDQVHPSVAGEPHWPLATGH